VSKLSIMQLPKDGRFLKCLTARPGHSIVYLDFNALEPTVLTEFSKDPRMLSLYGEGAKENNIYIYFGAHTKTFGAKIREHYDPENPTPDSIKAVKKAYPGDYDVLKICVLGMQYGMGVNTLIDNLALEGYYLKYWEADAIHKDYWSFFGGIKKFEHKLNKLFILNNGYILNGRGRPLGLHVEYKKDIVNRFVQSTGHDILIYYVMLLNKLRKERKVPMRPFCVDEHDASFWEVRDESIPEAVKIYEDALVMLNDTIKWSIKFRGQVKHGKNFSIKL
jgi:DNA polymerase I-like protein with 3'-5' exonuclease and polymerase domains